MSRPVAYLIVFVASACTLILELVAGRILAPYIGVSLYTWTSIIGVVLAGISLGNYLGGRIADRWPERRTLGVLLAAGGLASLAILPLINIATAIPTAQLVDPSNQLGGALPLDRAAILILRIVVITTLIFFPPSFILGMVSPVVIKLTLQDLAHSGGLVGDAPTTPGWLDVDRRAILDGERTLLDVVVERDLVLDGGALTPVARWITPPGAPRRYDTWFFVTAAPDGHAYVHDDDETVASEWLTPNDALARAREREIDLIYPTFRSLQVLSRFDGVAELLDAIAARWRAASPWRDESPDNGWMLDLPKGEDDEREAAANSVRTGRRTGAGLG